LKFKVGDRVNAMVKEERAFNGEIINILDYSTTSQNYLVKFEGRKDLHNGECDMSWGVTPMSDHHDCWWCRESELELCPKDSCLGRGSIFVNLYSNYSGFLHSTISRNIDKTEENKMELKDMDKKNIADGIKLAKEEKATKEIQFAKDTYNSYVNQIEEQNRIIKKANEEIDRLKKAFPQF